MGEGGEEDGEDGGVYRDRRVEQADWERRQISFFKEGPAGETIEQKQNRIRVSITTQVPR